MPHKYQIIQADGKKRLRFIQLLSFTKNYLPGGNAMSDNFFPEIITNLPNADIPMRHNGVLSWPEKLNFLLMMKNSFFEKVIHILSQPVLSAGPK